MDAPSPGTPPKRIRSKTAKPDEPVKATATEPVKPAKKGAAAPSARKSKTLTAPATKQQAPIDVPPDVMVTSITTITTPDESELLEMIATAAYYLAEQRQFTPGHEVEDWLEAERQIRALHT